MVLALLVTVLLLPLVVVMVWRCWNLPPVPAIRWWAIGFAGASLAWLAAHWRAELLKKRYDELEAKFRSIPRQSQSRRLRLPSTEFSYQDRNPSFQGLSLLDAEACFVSTPIEFGIAADTSVILDWYQKTVLQSIVHTESVIQD